MQKEFIEEEIRSEFKVSSKRKRIWQCELSLVKELQRVCQKYGLRYYASNGTLLGVIRHQGFIPWDDDVDIMMPRPDYEKLLSVADKEFQSPYFLQTAFNEKDYFRYFARLRNTETTAMTMRGWDKQTCHGIFIDIFPIDGSPDNAIVAKWQAVRIKWYCALANTYMYYGEFKPSIMRKIMMCAARIYCKRHGWNHLVRHIETLRMKVPFENAENVFVFCHGGKWIPFPKSYLDNPCVKDFEYIQIAVPKEYDKLLTLHYGDYMKLPPVNERGEHHTIFFDPDRSYKEYAGKLSLEDARKLFNNY